MFHIVDVVQKITCIYKKKRRRICGEDESTSTICDVGDVQTDTVIQIRDRLRKKLDDM